MAIDSGYPVRKGPSLWWFAVAFGILVLSVAPLIWVSANAITGIADYRVHDFDSEKQTELSIDDNQVAIFSAYEGPGVVRCSGSDDGSSSMEPLDHPSTSVNVSIGSSQWSRVAVTPESWPAGDYTVRCDLASGVGKPVILLAYADNPSIMSTVIGFIISIGVAMLGGVVALIVTIVVLVKRSRAKRPPKPAYPVFPPGPPPAA